MNRRAAVLGSPIAHSLSPVLHAAAYREIGLDWTYGAHRVEEDGLAEFVADLGPAWAGLSLTMPLKRVALDVCDHLSETARIVGGANTLVFAADGTVQGENTDVPGLVNALAEAGVGRVGAASVIGGGATAASAIAALAQLCNGPVEAFVRSLDRAAPLLPVAAAFEVDLRLRSWAEIPAGLHAPLVLATTPGGATDAIAADVPSGPGVLFDVAYHPWPTALAQAWEKAGGQVVSGLELLVHQAVLQVELMTGMPVPRADVVAAMRNAGLAALAAR
ncbi:MAG: shikimate dehydrogenase [Sporichthyaceae bacterium]